ncbi:hypothetical protein ACOSQ3_017250 [Xanthoceras sorbifolium]
MEGRNRGDSDKAVFRAAHDAQGPGILRQPRREGIDLNLPIGARAWRTAGASRSREEREDYVPDQEDGRRVREASLDKKAGLEVGRCVEEVRLEVRCCVEDVRLEVRSCIEKKTN